MKNLKRYLSLLLAAAMIMSFPFTASAANLNVTVDWDTEYQTMEGLGGAYAFNKAHALQQIAEFDPETTAHLVDLIFDDENGTGHDIVRVIMGDGGIRPTGTSSAPGFNPLNGVLADVNNPGYDIEGNKMPLPNKFFSSATNALNNTNATLADSSRYGFAVGNGTSSTLPGAYGFNIDGNRYYNGTTDSVWPNEPEHEAGTMVPATGYAWELDSWDTPIQGDEGGLTSDFIGKGLVNMKESARTVKDLFDVDQVWIMKQAQAYGVSTFYACAWTPPYWMKTNFSIYGSDVSTTDYLRLDTDANGKKIYFQAYADYIVGYVLGYWQEFGIPITHVGPYNESESSHGYSGFRSRNSNEVQELVMEYIIPAINKAFNRTDGTFKDIESPDGEKINFVPEVVIGDGTSLSQTFGNSFTGPVIKNAANFGKFTISTHFYGTTNMNTTANTVSGSPGATPLTATPGSNTYASEAANYSIWQTEFMNQSGTSGADQFTQKYDFQSINDAIRYAYMITNCFNSTPGFNAYIWWTTFGNNGADGSDLFRLQTNGAPQNATGSTLNGTYRIFKRFYTFGHFTRFTNPGDIRIDSTTFTGSSDQLNSTAYKSADAGDFSVTFTNAQTSAKTVDVTLKNFDGYNGDLDAVTVFVTSESMNMKKLADISVSGGSFTLDIPAKSVVTVVPSDGNYATFNGLDGERDIFSSLEAEDADNMIGRTDLIGETAVALGHGSALEYKNVNFADGSANGGITRRHLLYLTAYITDAPKGGILRVYVADPGSELYPITSQTAYVGEIIIPAGSSGTFRTRINTSNTGAFGLKDLCLAALGEINTDLFTVDMLRFSADDTAFGAVIPEAVGVLQNGDFENRTGGGSVTGWSASGTGTLSATVNQNYSGLGVNINVSSNSSLAASAMLANRAAGSGIQQSLNGKVTVGERYTFRGFYMPTADDSTAMAELVYLDASGAEIGRDLIAQRGDLGLLPSREGGIHPRNDVYTGIPLSPSSFEPIQFRPTEWYEVSSIFTYAPPEGTATTYLRLSDNLAADLYFDEVTLAATPDRFDLLNVICSADGTAAFEALRAQAIAAFSNPNLTQAQVEAIMSGYHEERIQLKIVTDKNPVIGKNSYFNVASGFTKEIASNAVKVTYRYDAEKFDLHGFTPAEGISLLATDTVNVDTGEATVTDVTYTLANLSGKYDTEDFGSAMFATKADIEPSIGYHQFGVYAEFVLKNDDAKVISYAGDNVYIKTIPMPDPDVIDLIYLSNVIDFFGVKEGEDRWADAEFYDYNGNGEIDITDIAFVAQQLK